MRVHTKAFVSDDVMGPSTLKPRLFDDTFTHFTFIILVDGSGCLSRRSRSIFPSFSYMKQLNVRNQPDGPAPKLHCCHAVFLCSIQSLVTLSCDQAPSISQAGQQTKRAPSVMGCCELVSLQLLLGSRGEHLMVASSW